MSPGEQFCPQLRTTDLNKLLSYLITKVGIRSTTGENLVLTHELNNDEQLTGSVHLISCPGKK